MGDEDDDWAVLEQRRDFSEMQEPSEKGSRLSPTTALGDVHRPQREDRRWPYVALMLAVVFAVVGLLLR
jgi:hypothetical protein